MDDCIMDAPIGYGAWGEWYLDSHSELETFMDFKMWLTLYKADSDNWFTYDGEREGHPVLMPYYRGADNLLHFIKFTNRREYRKYKHWHRKTLAKGEDAQNVKEQTELATMVREKATERAQALQKEMTEHLTDMKEMLSRFSDEETPAWVKAVQYTQDRLDNTVAYDSKGRRIYFEQRG